MLPMLRTKPLSPVVPLPANGLIAAIEGTSGPVETIENHRQACYIDGLLTAAAIGPFRTTPLQWLQALTGDTTPDESNEQNQLLLMTLTLAYTAIVTALQRGRDDYEPALFQHLDSTSAADHASLCGAWADGFGDAIRFDEAPWDELHRLRQGQSMQQPSLLQPWARLLLDRRGNPVLPPELTPDDADARRRAVLDLPLAILRIRDQFSPLRDAAAPG